ncbi:MAG: hypothetical protein SGJ15_10035, partial [Bacteroidota bacterium]|nr:hypothetical protein [Bacteroidota bacterium]
ALFLNKLNNNKAYRVFEGRLNKCTTIDIITKDVKVTIIKSSIVGSSIVVLISNKLGNSKANTIATNRINIISCITFFFHDLFFVSQNVFLDRCPSLAPNLQISATQRRFCYYKYNHFLLTLLSTFLNKNPHCLTAIRLYGIRNANK